MRKVTLQKQAYTISGKSNIHIGIEISPDEIQFINEKNDIEFIFKDTNDPETLERWQEVIKLMDMAVKFGIQALEKPKTIKLQLKKLKGGDKNGRHK